VIPLGCEVSAQLLSLALTLRYVFAGSSRFTEGSMMIHRLFVSMTVAGLLCGYMAMLYALMRIVVLIDHSYFVSLAM
jgi:hypothetical protein